MTEQERTDAAITAPDLCDPDAFGRWYDEHWTRLVRHASRLTSEPALAEDLAADALLRSWQSWLVRGVPERPFSYVATVVRNLAADHYRRDATDRRRSLELVEPPTGSPEAAVVDREVVRAMLRKLSSKERTAVFLHYLEGRSCEEIAEHLSVRPVSVRSQLHRGRRRLAAAHAA